MSTAEATGDERLEPSASNRNRWGDLFAALARFAVIGADRERAAYFARINDEAVRHFRDVTAQAALDADMATIQSDLLSSWVDLAEKMRETQGIIERKRPSPALDPGLAALAKQLVALRQAAQYREAFNKYLATSKAAGKPETTATDTAESPSRGALAD